MFSGALMKISILSMILLCSCSSGRLMAQDVIFFKNGYLIERISDDDWRSFNNHMEFKKAEPIGGTSRWVPGAEDLILKGVDRKKINEIIGLIASADSLITEGEYGSCVIAADHSRLLFVYKK